MKIEAALTMLKDYFTFNIPVGVVLIIIFIIIYVYSKLFKDMKISFEAQNSELREAHKVLLTSYREKEKQPNYTDLLIESRFFEHLPITESWLTDVYLLGQEVERENRNPLKEEEVKNPLKEEEVKNLTSPLEEYIFSGKVIDIEAFGKSIYKKSKL